MGDEIPAERRKRLHREYNKTYRERHPERIKQQKQSYRLSEKGKAKRKEFLVQNHDNDILSKRRHYLKNKEIYDEQARLYAMLHPEWKAAQCAKRRATKANATPAWVGPDELFLIEEAYRLARMRKEYTGISWDVDHILPLKSKQVCGLHTISNLQVVPSSYNYRKHNKVFNEDYFNRAI